ncbi:MAG: hypothetical protein FJ291_22365 [Planctomycetes bacterium]|nr:hypothetical protein [Planctomycetota bacterium]
MRKSSVIILCALTVALFAGLVYYGWANRWGGPPQGGVDPPPELAMPYVECALALGAADFDAAPWKDLAPFRVQLLHQITAAPHATGLVPELRVRAFHDGKDAYFLFEWPDAQESREHGAGHFPDACAVAFSLAPEPPKHSIMMGFESPVNIWQWKADLDAQVWKVASGESAASPNEHYTYEEPAAFPARTTPPSSACQDLISPRPGLVTPKPWGRIAGRGQWRDGHWRVILKRALAAAPAGLRADVQLTPGRHYTAFAAWNGDTGDRGARKSISDWVILDVQPAAPGQGRSASTHEIGAEGPWPAKHAKDAKRAGDRRSKIEDQESKIPPRGPAFSLFPTAAAGTVDPEPPKEPEPRVITIKAKRFEYMPSEITVQKGERITLRLESLDVTHGLYLDGYEVDIKANPTKVGVATFVADKPGRFTFRCSETCGEFHPYMIGYLMVEPNTRFRVYVVATIGLAVAAAVLVFFRTRQSKGAAPNA